MPSEKNEQQTGDALVKRAQALMDIRRWREALKLLGQALAISPDSADIFCRISYVKLNIGEYEQALADADSAARNEPTNEWAYRLRFRALLQLDKKSEALRAAEEAVRLAPQSWEPFYCLAVAQIANRMLSEARQSASRAQEIAPESPNSYEILATVEMECADWSEAEKHLRKALSLNPASYRALNDLGVCLSKQNREPEALEMYLQAARANPLDEIARNNLKSLAAMYLPGNRWARDTTLIFVYVLVVNAVAIIAITAVSGGPWSEIIGCASCPLTAVGIFILIFYQQILRAQPSFEELSPSVQNFLRAERRQGKIRAVLLSVCVPNALIIIGCVAGWFMGLRHTIPSSATGWAIFAYLFASSIISAAILFIRRRA